MKIFIAILAMAASAIADESVAEKALYDGNNDFTAKMFTEVVKLNPGKSVVLSAFSVLSPLAQLGLASDAEARDELFKAIGMPNENITKEAFTAVNAKLRKVSGIDLKTASRIYVANGLELQDNFAELSRSVFDSDVKNVDFSKNIETATAINTWVEDQTNKRIKDLVDPDSLTTDTRAVLVNALYFKGTWKDKFDPALTKDRDFHVSKDKTIQVPTMHRNGDYKYGESAELDAKLLEIFYDGFEASFLVILPNQIDGLAALEEKLKDPAVLEKAVNEMFTFEVNVYLPKFKIETTTNLKEVLQKMGLKKMFTPGEANLKYLLKSDEDLYVSDAIQKAFIEINEEGAEAAAANEFGIAYLSAVINELPKKEFVADHPFVYTLRLNEPHDILFNGVFQP